MDRQRSLPSFHSSFLLKEMSVTGVLVLLTRTSWLPVLAALLFAASFNNRQAVAGPFATAAASHSADARRRFHVQSPPDYFDVDQNERAIVIDATSWRIVAPLAGGGDFGSDPLDPYGGVFEQWKREDRKQTRYVSELVEGAYVGWSDLEVQTTSRDDHGNVKANFTVAFPVEQVNARLLSEFFGKGGYVYV